jgi:hypothetical protein
MSLKAQAIKEALANMRKKTPAKQVTTDNPAIETEEHTPGKKKALPLKGSTGKPVASNASFWHKPKGTAENPIASENPAKVVKKKVVKRPFYQKAKTRGAI